MLSSLARSPALGGGPSLSHSCAISHHHVRGLSHRHARGLDHPASLLVLGECTVPRPGSQVPAFHRREAVAVAVVYRPRRRRAWLLAAFLMQPRRRCGTAAAAAHEHGPAPREARPQTSSRDSSRRPPGPVWPGVRAPRGANTGTRHNTATECKRIVFFVDRSFRQLRLLACCCWCCCCFLSPRS